MTGGHRRSLTNALLQAARQLWPARRGRCVIKKARQYARAMARADGVLCLVSGRASRLEMLGRPGFGLHGHDRLPTAITRAQRPCKLCQE